LEVKLFEVLDRVTCCSLLAVRFRGVQSDKERWILHRAGFSEDAPLIQVTELETGQTERDPYKWRSVNRTLFEAHKYLLAHWDELSSGSTIDIEYILGEKPSPRLSQFKV